MCSTVRFIVGFEMCRHIVANRVAMCAMEVVGRRACAVAVAAQKVSPRPGPNMSDRLSQWAYSEGSMSNLTPSLARGIDHLQDPRLNKVRSPSTMGSNANRVLNPRAPPSLVYLLPISQLCRLFLQHLHYSGFIRNNEVLPPELTHY